MKYLLTILMMTGFLSLSVDVNAQNNSDSYSYPNRMLGVGVSSILEGANTTVRYQRDNWFYNMEIRGTRFQREFSLDGFELSENLSELVGDQGNTSWNYTFAVRATRVKWFDIGDRLSMYAGAGAGIGTAQSLSSNETETFFFPDSSSIRTSENQVNSFFATISAVGGVQYKLGKRFSLTAEIDGIQGQATWNKVDRLVIRRQFSSGGTPSNVDVSRDDFSTRRTDFNMLSGGRLIIGYHF